MVLRRPYAFLIKHFKKIHLILLLIMGYLTYTLKNTLDFYNEFIASKITLISADRYISIITYIAVIFVIAISFLVFYLMKYKKKPRLLYIILMIGYALLFIVLMVIKSNLVTLEFQALDQRTIRLVRDVVEIVFAIQVVSLFPILVRTLGFNIKKFDFEKDLLELNVSSEDSEEVEVNLDVNANTITRTSRRQLRELKYYYKENMAFINIFLGIIIIVVVVVIALNVKVFNKVYKQNENINTTSFNFNIEDSYVTETDKNGKKVAKNNTIYVLVKFTIKSNYNNSYVLDTNKFILQVKDKNYIPTKKYYSYFNNIANGYTDQILSYDNNKQYLLVYNIPNEYKKAKMYLRYDETYDTKYKIKLTPINNIS